MPIPANIQQRDLVKLAVLMCGDRSGAKYRPPAKGTQSTSNPELWRNYAR